MKAYQSTAAQARFADSLGEQVGDDVFEQCFAKAAQFKPRDASPKKPLRN